MNRNFIPTSYPERNDSLGKIYYRQDRVSGYRAIMITGFTNKGHIICRDMIMHKTISIDNMFDMLIISRECTDEYITNYILVRSAPIQVIKLGIDEICILEDNYIQWYETNIGDAFVTNIKRL